VKTFLTAQWENLIMANYAVEPQMLQPYLPKGVELDLYEGEAYVSLGAFTSNEKRLRDTGEGLSSSMKPSLTNP